MKSNEIRGMINISQNKNHQKLRQIANDTLRIGDLSCAVELPKGHNINEWLAVNTIEFYNEIALLFGCLTDFCSKESCPTMSAGLKYEYLWADPNTNSKPMKVNAKEYIEFLMKWVENQIHNEVVFPSEPNVPFPSNFEGVIRIIFKRLFRIYAHIYYSHFHQIQVLEAEPHLNTSFKHFIYFVEEFGLIDKRDMTPLSDLINEFKLRKTAK